MFQPNFLLVKRVNPQEIQPIMIMMYAFLTLGAAAAAATTTGGGGVSVSLIQRLTPSVSHPAIINGRRLIASFSLQYRQQVAPHATRCTASGHVMCDDPGGRLGAGVMRLQIRPNEERCRYLMYIRTPLMMAGRYTPVETTHTVRKLFRFAMSTDEIE